MPRRRQAITLAALSVVLFMTPSSEIPAQQGTRVIARFSFEGAAPAASPGLPPGKMQGASQIEGHEGKALAFEDWSVRDYLKPNPAQAMRLVVPHDDRLNPPLPFSVSAWIYPTADPIYYGGIVEKGEGFGGSYRLILLRGLRVAGSVGARSTTVRSAEPISLNAWHEVRLSATAGTLVLYVDGKKSAETPLPSGTLAAAKNDLVIGERFTGRIDEVTISSAP